MSKQKRKTRPRAEPKLKKVSKEPAAHVHKWRFPKSGGRECTLCCELE